MTYGLIGEHLGHSFSKLIHEQLFDYNYDLQELTPSAVDAFMKGKNFRAINVTIPYKETVIPYLDEISDTARLVGAVNTVVNREGRLYGYNTDFGGMIAMLENAGISLADKNVLILGNGGTAKTALAVATHLGCAAVHRVSRRGGDGCLTYAEAATYNNTQIIINTTPCGMYPHLGESAIDLSPFPHLEGVVDAIYNPLRSHLLCEAAARGIPTVGGLYMLVAQAVLAAELFVNKTVGREQMQRLLASIVSQKQNIVLIGMPGCGKSTVGALLSKRLGRRLIDTDALIVEREGRSIPTIFEQSGEDAFRAAEAAVIRETAAEQGVIIAVGGGAVLRDDNVSLLKENGRLYFLDRPLEDLIPTDDRPLSSDRDALAKRYHERYGRYCDCCDCHITETSSPERTAGCIEEEFFGESTGN